MPGYPLSLPQARALLRHAEDGTPPPDMHGGDLNTLRRAAEKLRYETERYRVKPIALYATIDDLGDALLDVRDEKFRDLIHGRARDLLATCRLWNAAQGLPHLLDRERLLNTEKIDSIGWAADVLDALEAAGLSFGGDDA